MSEKNTGRVTIPTNLDVVPETIELMKRWGADAIRDCDGTEFPEELTKTGAKMWRVPRGLGCLAGSVSMTII